MGISFPIQVALSPTKVNSSFLILLILCTNIGGKEPETPKKTTTSTQATVTSIEENTKVLKPTLTGEMVPKTTTTMTTSTTSTYRPRISRKHDQKTDASVEIIMGKVMPMVMEENQDDDVLASQRKSSPFLEYDYLDYDYNDWHPISPTTQAFQDTFEIPYSPETTQRSVQIGVAIGHNLFDPVYDRTFNIGGNSNKGGSGSGQNNNQYGASNSGNQYGGGNQQRRPSSGKNLFGGRGGGNKNLFGGGGRNRNRNRGKNKGSLFGKGNQGQRRPTYNSNNGNNNNKGGFNMAENLRRYRARMRSGARRLRSMMRKMRKSLADTLFGGLKKNRNQNSGNQQYGAPQQNQQQYGPPQQNQQQYGPPQQNQQQYGPPQQNQQQYGPPQQNQQQYGAPQQPPPQQQYGGPQQPPQQPPQLPPQQPPQQQYGGPQKPPQQPPNQTPQGQYGGPQQPPQQLYGGPQQPPQQQYGNVATNNPTNNFPNPSISRPIPNQSITPVPTSPPPAQVGDSYGSPVAPAIQSVSNNAPQSNNNPFTKHSSSTTNNSGPTYSSSSTGSHGGSSFSPAPSTFTNSNTFSTSSSGSSHQNSGLSQTSSVSNNQVPVYTSNSRQPLFSNQRLAQGESGGNFARPSRNVNVDQQEIDLHDVREAWYNYYRKAKAYQKKYRNGLKDLKRIKKEILSTDRPLFVNPLNSLNSIALRPSLNLVEDTPTTLQALSPHLKVKSNEGVVVGPGFSSARPDDTNPYSSGNFLQSPAHTSRFRERFDETLETAVRKGVDISELGDLFNESSRRVKKYESILTPSLS